MPPASKLDATLKIPLRKHENFKSYSLLNFTIQYFRSHSSDLIPTPRIMQINPLSFISIVEVILKEADFMLSFAV